ncbi:MAG: DEAD/DEAH box helicase [Ignisphaera sp.]|uniref:DEAD/DEAH box helicase n=1 Tax=Ignisphaera aggregans TaxID=334771 RepID=A0A7C4NT19_9CREN
MSDANITLKDIPEDLSSLLHKMGYSSFTVVQSIAIPKIIKHDLDIVVAAPTGSGKTEAAVVPLLYKLTRGSIISKQGIKILYITPLRALNRDIHNRIHKIARYFGLTAEVWHGDTPSSTRKRILRSPPDILITTPESLQIILVKEDIRKNIESLYAVVVDEVQDLISSERGAELAVALERLDSIINKHARRVLISSPIGDIDAVASYFFAGRRYDVAYAKGVKKYSIAVTITDKEYKNGVFDVEHVYNDVCREISSYEYGKQILVFANTRTSAEELGFNLTKCLGRNIALHHGSLSRDIREVVEAMFKSGDTQVVVATSSLELGIDIGGVDLVIQYLSPRQALKLVQRVGRAGHKEHAVSRGIIVVPPLVIELLESIVIARRAIRGFLEPVKPHNEPLDVLAHQVIGLILERGEASIDELLHIISRATPLNTLTLSKFEKIIEFLNSLGLIKCSNNTCKSSKKGMLYYLTTNMIPDTVHYNARSILDGKTLGLLDEEFALSCNEEDVVVLAGKLWKVINIDVEKRELVVAPIESSDLAVLPRWVGELIPVHRNVAREICAFVRRFCNCKNNLCLDNLFSEYGFNETTKQFLTSNREKLCEVYPRDDFLVVEVNRLSNEGKTMMTFYTCLGSKASEAFSLLMNYIVRDTLGISSAYKSHQLGTVLLINTVINKDGIGKLIKKLRSFAYYPDRIREIIEYEVKNTSIFKHRLIAVAKKFGVISKDVEAKEVKRIVEGLMNIDVLVYEALRELYTEKIDIDEMLRYLKNLADNRLKIKVFIRQSVSPFVEEISSLGMLRTLVKQSLIPKDILIEIARRRLLNKEVKVFCTSCYHIWSFTISQRITECENIFSCFIECPRCKSRAVTVIENEEEVPPIKKALSKIKQGTNHKLKLLSLEKEVLNKHRKIMDFVMSHGIAGIIALQGVGVGIETAKRLLSKSTDLNSLIMNILEQEKIFLRTSKYWKR